MESKTHWVTLSMVPGIGPKTFRALVERFGSPEAVFEASVEKLATVPRVTPELAQRLLAAPLAQVEEELLFLAAEGIQVLTLADESYPANLRLIADAPPVLFIRGDLQPEDERAVAIVGSRQASEEGLALAEELAGELAERGFTIVSGLAKGIDTAAHWGALAAGGRTLGVLGSGLRRIHPRENAGLAEEITRHGALLSELHPDTPPLGRHLMARDRLISGLSLGVIVVEAAERSGSLDTAARARQQGRLLFAVDSGSPGTQRLLEEGALRVTATQPDVEALANRMRAHGLEDQEEIRQIRLF